MDKQNDGVVLEQTVKITKTTGRTTRGDMVEQYQIKIPKRLVEEMGITKRDKIRLEWNSSEKILVGEIVKHGKTKKS